MSGKGGCAKERASVRVFVGCSLVQLTVSESLNGAGETACQKVEQQPKTVDSGTLTEQKTGRVN